MPEDMLKKRERGLEEEWVNRHERELVEKLRQRGSLDEIGMALAVKLQADDPVLLQRARDLGITLENGPAFLLAPLVQVAWAEGTVTEAERDAVLRIAGHRGIDPASTAFGQLVAWLNKRPSDELFDTAIEVLKAGFSVLTPPERQERIAVLGRACREVAQASGGVWKQLGLSSGVSGEEHSLLDQLKAKLRA
jgi:hypothetical protein